MMRIFIILILNFGRVFNGIFLWGDGFFGVGVYLSLFCGDDSLLVSLCQHIFIFRFWHHPYESIHHIQPNNPKQMD